MQCMRPEAWELWQVSSLGEDFPTSLHGACGYLAPDFPALPWDPAAEVTIHFGHLQVWDSALLQSKPLAPTWHFSVMVPVWRQRERRLPSLHMSIKCPTL